MLPVFMRWNTVYNVSRVPECEHYSYNECVMCDSAFFFPRREARRSKMALSLGYHGNIVALWWVLINGQVLTVYVSVCLTCVCVCLGSVCGRSTSAQENCWWIWVLIRRHCTTRSVVVITRSSSALRRPTSSWTPTLRNSEPPYMKGTHTYTHHPGELVFSGLSDWSRFCTAWMAKYRLFKHLIHIFTFMCFSDQISDLSLTSQIRCSVGHHSIKK